MSTVAMHPALIALLVVLLAVAAALLLYMRLVAVRRTAKLRPVIERRLEILIWTVNEWKGSFRDLIPAGTLEAAAAKTSTELLQLSPSPGERWIILFHPTWGVRLVMGLAPAEPTLYPYSGWSREPWLKAQLDHLREAIAKLPPPPTPEEELARHRAIMAESAAHLAELEAALAALNPPDTKGD